MGTSDLEPISQNQIDNLDLGLTSEWGRRDSLVGLSPSATSR